MNTFEFQEMRRKKYIAEACECTKQLTIFFKERRTHTVLVNARVDGHAFVNPVRKGFHVLGGCKKQELLDLGIKIHDTFNRMYNWYFVLTCDELQKIIARIDYKEESK